MSRLVNASMRQYAVISLRTETRRERLVIAYPDERSLRDLLAAPSILALGYRSREEAQAYIDRCTTTVHASHRKLTATLVDITTRSLRKLVSSCWLSRFSLAKTQSIICDVVGRQNSGSSASAGKNPRILQQYLFKAGGFGSCTRRS